MIPRITRRSSTSSASTVSIAAVATPYTIQRGPSAPMNTDAAFSVRACSSRPQSPWAVRTRAPPPRRDSSISSQSSGHSPADRGAASALTAIRPSGSIRCTAWGRPPSAPSSFMSAPNGTGTCIDPRSTRASASVIDGSSSSTSAGPSGRPLLPGGGTASGPSPTPYASSSYSSSSS